MQNQWEGYSADRRVRQALNLLINKKEMSQSLFAGRAGLLDTAPNTWALGSQSYEPYPYDPDKAKALLAAAGYPKGFEVTMLSLPMAPIPLVVEAVAGYLKVGGITNRLIIV